MCLYQQLTEIIFSKFLVDFEDFTALFEMLSQQTSALDLASS